MMKRDDAVYREEELRIDKNTVERMKMKMGKEM